MSINVNKCQNLARIDELYTNTGKFPLIYFYLLNAGVSLATGVALWLVWWQDRQHVFARSVAFAQLAYVIPTVILVAWAGHNVEPSTQVLAVLAVSMAFAYMFLVRALVELQGQLIPLRWQVLMALVLFAGFELAAQAKRPDLMGAQSFLVLVSVGIWAARKLWARGVPEKVLCLCVMLMSFNSLDLGWMGPGDGYVQSGFGTLLRLVAVMAFAFAAMDRSRASIQHLRDRFEKISANSLQGIVVADGTTLHYANAAALSIFGFASFEDAQQAGPVSVLTAGDRARTQEEASSVLTGAHSYHDVERSAVRPGGEEIRLRLSSWPVSWDGKLASQIVVIDEIGRAHV